MGLPFSGIIWIISVISHHKIPILWYFIWSKIFYWFFFDIWLTECFLTSINIYFTVFYQHSLSWKCYHTLNKPFCLIIRIFEDNDISTFRIVKPIGCSKSDQFIIRHDRILHRTTWNIRIDNYKIQDKFCQKNRYNNTCDPAKYLTLETSLLFFICIFFAHIDLSLIINPQNHVWWYHVFLVR